ncbi:MAG: hypothetical protein Q9170_005894 [Blastenia crenularia]
MNYCLTPPWTDQKMGQGFEVLSVPERRMLAHVGQLTDIPGWHEKVFIDNFVNSWKAAALRNDGVTQCMRISEVRWYSKEFKHDRIMPALDGGIFKADELVPSTVARRVQDAVSDLEGALRHSGISYADPYINNVHSIQQNELYTTVDAFIDICIPLFNKSLTIIQTPSKFFSLRINVEDRANGPLPNREPGVFQSPEERIRPEYLGSKGKPRKKPVVNLQQDFREAGLQLVLEVASIGLHPEQLTFPSQEWHIQALPVNTYSLVSPS